MAKIDLDYHKLLNAILETGYTYKTENRPDVEMKQITSANLEIDLDEFPALTTKKLFWKGVVAELIWFLRGEDNIKYLVDNGVHIWDKDAYNWYKKHYEQHVTKGKAAQQNQFTLEEFVSMIEENDLDFLRNSQGMKGYTLGDVGRNYGVQWRDFRGFDGTKEWGSPGSLFRVDQIVRLMNGLRKPNPISRRHIVTAWNPAELDQTALPPCHWAFEILPRPLSMQHKMKYAGGDKEYLDTLWNSAYLKNDKEAKSTLDKEVAGVPDYGFVLKWHQRSVDTFLGLPFNIASYGLLANIIGVLTGIKPLSLIGDLSNVHIYGPHTEAVRKQLGNSVMAYEGTQLEFSERFIKDAEAYRKNELPLSQLINNLEIDDFKLPGYKSFPSINAKMYEPKK